LPEPKRKRDARKLGQNKTYPKENPIIPRKISQQQWGKAEKWGRETRKGALPTTLYGDEMILRPKRGGSQRARRKS